MPEHPLKTDSSGHQRKRDEEHCLPRDLYFSEGYFSQKGLYSLCQQLIEVHQTGCETLLEIGKGNGFVSEFLRSAGVKVTTVDVNPSLQPDVVGSIQDLHKIFGQQVFDCVLCAEVLEHMPFSELLASLRTLRKHTHHTCIITLPRCDPAPYEISFQFTLPRIGTRKASLSFPRRTKKNPIYPGHHWELNHTDDSSLEAIRRGMLQSFSAVKDYRFEFNPYHHFFILKT